MPCNYRGDGSYRGSPETQFAWKTCFPESDERTWWDFRVVLEADSLSTPSKPNEWEMMAGWRGPGERGVNVAWRREDWIKLVHLQLNPHLNPIKSEVTALRDSLWLGMRAQSQGSHPFHSFFNSPQPLSTSQKNLSLWRSKEIKLLSFKSQNTHIHTCTHTK